MGMPHSSKSINDQENIHVHLEAEEIIQNYDLETIMEAAAQSLEAQGYHDAAWVVRKLAEDPENNGKLFKAILDGKEID